MSGGLGSRWTRRQAVKDMRVDRRPPRPNFGRVADLAAARLAAETVHAQPPQPVVLSDDALIAVFAGCSMRRSELPAVRAAFFRIYGDRVRCAPTSPVEAA